MKIEACKNCGAPVDGNYCSNCGQKTSLKPITLSSLMKDLSENVLQLEYGLFFTILELTKTPAETIKNYLDCKRKHYFQPVAYAFTLASLYFLLSQLVEHNTFINSVLEGVLLASEDSHSDKVLINGITWLADNYAITTLLVIPIFSLSSYLAFIKDDKNYLEHVVINLYITGHQSLIYSAFALLGILVTNSDLIETISLFVSVSYASFVLVTLFNRSNWPIRFLKVFLSYVLAISIMLVLLVVTAILLI